MTTTKTTPVKQAPNALMARARWIRSRSAAGDGVAQFPIPVPDHAGLAQGEGGEHPDDVELDQPGGRSVERIDQPAGDQREQDDAVGEGQPVTAGVQLPRQVAVLREDRAEQGKPL